MLRGVGSFIGFQDGKSQAYRAVDAFVGAPIMFIGGLTLRSKNYVFLGDALMLVGSAALAVNIIQMFASKVQAQPPVEVTIGEAEIL